MARKQIRTLNEAIGLFETVIFRSQAAKNTDQVGSLAVPALELAVGLQTRGQTLDRLEREHRAYVNEGNEQADAGVKVLFKAFQLYAAQNPLSKLQYTLVGDQRQSDFTAPQGAGLARQFAAISEVLGRRGMIADLEQYPLVVEALTSLEAVMTEYRPWLEALAGVMEQKRQLSIEVVNALESFRETVDLVHAALLKLYPRRKDLINTYFPDTRPAGKKNAAPPQA